MVAPFAVVLETFVVAVLAAFEAFANAAVAEESLEPVPMLDGSHLPIEVAAQYLRSLVTAVEAEVKYEAGVLVLGTVAAEIFKGFQFSFIIVMSKFYQTLPIVRYCIFQSTSRSRGYN